MYTLHAFFSCWFSHMVTQYLLRKMEMMMMIYNFSLASVPSRSVFLILEKQKRSFTCNFYFSTRHWTAGESQPGGEDILGESGVANKLLSIISKIVSNASCRSGVCEKIYFHMNSLTFCWLVVLSTSIYFCLVFDFAFSVRRTHLMTNSLKSGRKTIASSDTAIFLCCFFCKMPFAKPLILSLPDIMMVMIFFKE